VARGLLAALAAPAAPPAGFAERVSETAARAARAAQDGWRPAGRLVPAFAVAAIVLVAAYGASLSSSAGGLLPLEQLTAGEQLVLQAPSFSPDVVLTAIMSEDRP
jgi:hypothetical protein